mgnify:CR=1 FL=1
MAEALVVDVVEIAEEIAALLPGADVVKAFNTTGAENMADSHYAQGQPMMPVAGDGPAVPTVTILAYW